MLHSFVNFQEKILQDNMATLLQKVKNETYKYAPPLYLWLTAPVSFHALEEHSTCAAIQE